MTAFQKELAILQTTLNIWFQFRDFFLFFKFLYFTRHEIHNTILVSVLRLDSKMPIIVNPIKTSHFMHKHVNMQITRNYWGF